MWVCLVEHKISSKLRIAAAIFGGERVLGKKRKKTNAKGEGLGWAVVLGRTGP